MNEGWDASIGIEVFCPMLLLPQFDRDRSIGYTGDADCTFEPGEHPMAEGPDIARIASLIGDPARSNMLLALIGGKALTATELAGAAGVTLQTASSHLSKLEEGGLLCQRKQGRHRYFALATGHVGAMIESLMSFSAARGHLRHRTGPKEPELRKARICYDHLAGDYGVRMLDSLVAQGAIRVEDEALTLTAAGETMLEARGLDIGSLRARRRPLCRACLDWSERRTHLAGTLGAALLSHFLDGGLARRVEQSRIIRFSPEGERQFLTLFPLAD
jgi:DNA-binding transcriptional ArsR family regulator